VDNVYTISADLFGKQCIKFYQNRQSFVEDIIKTLWFFFWTHCIIKLM